ncbi:Helix-turn-helix domain-containing protein [Sinosporangium album]|uniref:Helix-turn-helix domain-containing protein n=1 Tax=Sinosporangium album TaxID=504805 RepID=A0A1G7ZM17_9ACTN|nr:helix-turn-helix transcriptional regulator [Sinosporangium album]SDH09150.1 Helix-turn-helix domain-containing protein [Sinosporangium album]
MASNELDPASSPLALFGAELRRIRSAQNLTLEQLAERIMFSPSLVGAIERATRRPGRDFVERCEEELGLSGELIRLWPLISKESSPKWFRSWTRIEQEARTLRTWEPLLVPGLLQTPGYARAVLSGEPGVSMERVEEMLEARLQRQILFQRQTPPMFQALIDESVLHRPIGGAEVMRQQLEHLLKQMAHPRITIQVVPLAVGSTTGLLGGFVIAQLGGAHDAVYLETANNGQVTDRMDDVDAVSLRYDAIRAWAHPLHVSENVIREMLVKYENR